VNEVKQNRTKREVNILYARRASGIVLNLCVVVGSWYAIFAIISTQKSVIDTMSLLIGPTIARSVHPAFAIIAVGLALPMLTFAITKFEQWESKIQTMKHQIWRLYIGRIANLIVSAMPAFVIYKDLFDTNFVYSTFSDPVDALVGKSEAGKYSIFEENKYLCFEDVASYYLLKLVISDFLLGKLIKVFVYYCKLLLKLQHSPYNVAESIIEILYTQGLIWLTLPLFPFLAIIAPILLFINFKFEKRVISKFKGKTDASWKAEETGSFFIIFYNLTLVVGLCVNWYFLQSEWPCYARTGSSDFSINLQAKQGAFADTEESKPWEAVNYWLSENNLSYAVDLMSNSLLFMAICAILTLRLALVGNVAQAKTQLLEVKDRQIDELYKKMWAQKRRLDLHLNQTK